MAWWETACLVLAVLAGSAMLVHPWLAWAALRKVNQPPAHYPALSVIRPVRGLDAGAEENLRSFLEQDYPAPWEAIFSLQDPDDAALPLLRLLAEKYPQGQIRIVVNDMRPGFTGKTSNLYYGTAAARHPVLVWSDADMRADSSFLRRLVAPLADPQVGVVSGVPVHRGGRGIWNTLYRLQLNATILLQWLPYTRFLSVGVTGGALALRREVVAAFGGVEAFAGYLADDVRIGLLVRQAGYQVRVGPAIEAPVGGKSREDLLSLLARGAVIYHLMLGGWMEAAYVLVAYLYWPLLLLGLGAGSLPLLLAVLIHLGAKAGTAWLVHRVVAKTPGWTEALAVPLLDALFLYLLVTAGRRRQVSWRGIAYHLDGEGRLVR